MSALHGLWLLVFAVDASLQGHGRSHQMGAVGLGLLCAVLVVGESRATRRDSRD